MNHVGNAFLKIMQRLMMTVGFTDNIVDRTIAKCWPPLQVKNLGHIRYNLLV